MPDIVERWQHARVTEALAQRRVVMLAGARQCGKTTLARSLDPQRFEYRTLDNRTLLEAARADPEGFVRHQRTPSLIIDEVQRAPELLLAIKQRVDEDTRPGQYLLTGSTSLAALPSATESLAGRVSRIRLRPFSSGEILGAPPGLIGGLLEGEPPTNIDHCSRDLVLELGFRGGFPEPVALPERARRRWHRDYIAALLDRDLQDVARITRVDAMRKLVDVLAAWSSSYLDIARTTSQMSIRRPTVESYINALEALYLAERLPAWTRTDYDRVGRRDKLFMTDTGLMAALLDWRLDQVRLDPDRAGKLAETLAFTELMAQVDLDPDCTAYHYRDWEQREIDLLVERRHDGALLGIEVKAAQSATRDDFRHLVWFRDNLAGSRAFTGVVLYTGTSVASFGERLWAVPFSALWSG
jgi:uncharacterized protein